MRESAIETELVNGIRALGGECFKWVSPGRVGVPDRIVLLPGGEAIFIELKAEGGSITRAQVAFQARLSALGFRVQTLWGVGDVRQFLCDL